MKKDDKADVVITGGGMTGALIAYELLKDQYDIVILDKDVPGYGSSDANTGIIQYNSDKSLYEMIEEHGKVRAVDFYRLSIERIQLLHKIASELKKMLVMLQRIASIYVQKKNMNLNLKLCMKLCGSMTFQQNLLIVKI